MIHSEAHYIQLGVKLERAPNREARERRLAGMRVELAKEPKEDLPEIRRLIERGVADARGERR